MKNILIFLGLLSIVTSLYAFEITQPSAEFSGIGRIKVPADYVSLVISVHSECYASPLLAQQATDEVVTKIDEYLQTLKTKEDQFFKILISGGFSSSFSQWRGDKELCRNTFQKDTEITLEIAASKDFGNIFAKIQSEALKYLRDPSDRRSLDQPLTYVSLGIPQAKITQKHRTMLEREARNLALLDAKANFKSAIKSCGKQRAKILSIRENGPKPEYIHPRPMLSQAKFASAPPESLSAPLRFDDLQISMELIVNFQFDSTWCFDE